MQNQDQSANQVSDFTASFRRSLERFESLSAGRKADYERSNSRARASEPTLEADFALADE